MDPVALVVLAGLGAVLIEAWAMVLAGRTGTTRAQWVARRRARRAELAAVEAADLEPVFDPARLREAVRAVYELAEYNLAQGQEPEDPVVRRWTREMSYRVVGGLRLLPRIRSHLVYVLNREGDREDRVVMWVRFRIEPRRGNPFARRLGGRTIDQHWTLGRHGQKWDLLAFSDEPSRRDAGWCRRPGTTTSGCTGRA